jgi:hypothetical protein
MGMLLNINKHERKIVMDNLKNTITNILGIVVGVGTVESYLSFASLSFNGHSIVIHSHLWKSDFLLSVSRNVLSLLYQWQYIFCQS